MMAARVTCSCGFTRTYPSRAKAEHQAGRHVCAKDDRVRRATRRHRCARCGLVAVYENAGAAEARHWFSKHSCRKREEALLRASLAAAKDALIDRTPKPCLHKVANHQHGTRAAYVLDRCRCKPCSKANSEAETWRERQKAYGRYHKYVPAGPVREHVQALRDAGMGLKTIALRSGVAHGALWKLVYGKKRTLSDGTIDQTPSRRVLRKTAEKLYALDPAGPLPLADGAVLDAEASARVSRKLQALVALGWSMSRLGNEIGISHVRNFAPVVKAERRLAVATARSAEVLFERLSMTLPPETNRRERIAASRSRKYAKAHGWVPPLALEDLDLPGCMATTAPELDEQAIWRRMRGDKSVPLTAAEKDELVRRWGASGRPLNECERVTGIGINVQRHKPERQTS